MQSWTWEKHATVAKDHDEWTGRVRDWINRQYKDILRCVLSIKYIGEHLRVLRDFLW